MLSWFRKKKGSVTPDRSRIVPRIKTVEMEAYTRGLNVAEDQLPYTEPLVADLVVAYGYDMPGVFQILTRQMVTELALSPAELRSLAITNLRSRLPQIATATTELTQQIICGNDLEACTLLATSYWDARATSIGGELVAAVPSRNVLIFCGSDSADGIDALQAISADVIGKAGTHGLTHQLLAWRNSQWEPFYPEPRERKFTENDVTWSQVTVPGSGDSGGAT